MKSEGASASGVLHLYKQQAVTLNQEGHIARSYGLKAT